MATHERNDVWHKLTMAHFAGNPVYFFDTSFLLSQITSLANWNPIRLEAAIAPRVENVLCDADSRYVTERGFYVIFGNYSPEIARQTASEICLDLLRHFFGRQDVRASDGQRFCCESSVQALVQDLGGPPPEQPASYSRARTPRMPQITDEKSFEKELLEFFMERVITDTSDQTFLFWPCWDTRKQRVAAFSCSHADAYSNRLDGPVTRSLAPAALQCQVDVAALAAATKAVRELFVRREPSPVSVPVHVETLSWSKTRNAYFEVLRQIDPALRSFLVPRIEGLVAGANLPSVAEWIAQFQRYVHRVLVQVNAAMDFSSAGQLGASGFGITMTSWMRNTKIPGETLADQAAKLNRICAGQRAVSYVQNVSTLPELFLLKAKGINIISGLVVGQGSLMPDTARLVTFDELEDLSEQPELEVQADEPEQDGDWSILAAIAGLDATKSAPENFKYVGRA